MLPSNHMFRQFTAYDDMKKPADTEYMKTATAKVRWYNTKHREGMCVSFQEKYQARQTRFIVSHQQLTQFACGQAVTINYSLLANAVYTRQIYGTTAIKVGMSLLGTVEAADLRGSGC